MNQFDFFFYTLMNFLRQFERIKPQQNQKEKNDFSPSVSLKNIFYSMVKGSSSICAELVERHSIAEAFYDAVGVKTAI